MERMKEKKGVGRPRDGDPEETRREILKAAEQSFASHGYVGATTRHVASQASVNVATLHYHFGNKEGLYRAVLAHVADGEIPALPETGAPVERFTRLVEGLVEQAVARPSLPRLALLNRLAGPGGGATSADRRVDVVESALRALHSNGLRKHDGRDDAANGSTACRRAAHAVVDLIDISAIAYGNRPSVLSDDPPPVKSVAAAALRLSGLE